MRILIVGADSLIGSELSAAMRRNGHSVLGTSRRAASQARIPLDLAAGGAGDVALPSCDAAVFCAAISSFEQCRAAPELAEQVNVVAPAAIARRLAEQGARVVLLSTSAVFDCNEPHMAVDRMKKPRGVYGALKAAAEDAFSSLGNAALVLRMTKVLTADNRLLRGWVERLRRSFSVTAFGDMSMSPIAVHHSVDALRALIESGADGIYQLSAADDMTYADVARHFATRLAADPALVRAGESRARIPVDEAMRFTSLDTARLSRATGFVPPAAKDVLDEVFGPLFTRRERA